MAPIVWLAWPFPMSLSRVIATIWWSLKLYRNEGCSILVTLIPPASTEPRTICPCVDHVQSIHLSVVFVHLFLLFALFLYPLLLYPLLATYYQMKLRSSPPS